MKILKILPVIACLCLGATSCSQKEEAPAIPSLSELIKWENTSNIDSISSWMKEAGFSVNERAVNPRTDQPLDYCSAWKSIGTNRYEISVFPYKDLILVSPDTKDYESWLVQLEELGYSKKDEYEERGNKVELFTTGKWDSKEVKIKDLSNEFPSYQLKISR